MHKQLASMSNYQTTSRTHL